MKKTSRVRFSDRSPQTAVEEEKETLATEPPASEVIIMEILEEPDEDEVDKDEEFPKERLKTLVMSGIQCVAAVLNQIVLSYIHERRPLTAPLPDLVFDTIIAFQGGLQICEYIMISLFAFTLILIAFHRHRWIVFRRLVTIGSLLYLLRCVTLIVTQLPVADEEFKCLPKLKGVNATIVNIVSRGWSQLFGLGLNLEKQSGNLCGDYLYSGHTIVLTISALFIAEYTPRVAWPLHWLAWTAATSGMTLLIVSRGHYTIDVIISYFLSTRIFWNYHTQAAHPNTRNSAHNHHRKEFWFPLFYVLENKIHTSIPYGFDFPVPSSVKTVIRRKLLPRIEALFFRE